MGVDVRALVHALGPQLRNGIAVAAAGAAHGAEARHAAAERGGEELRMELPHFVPVRAPRAVVEAVVARAELGRAHLTRAQVRGRGRQVARGIAGHGRADLEGAPLEAAHEVEVIADERADRRRVTGALRLDLPILLGHRVEDAVAIPNRASLFGSQLDRRVFAAAWHERAEDVIEDREGPE